MVLQPCDVYIVNEIIIRNAVYLQILLVKNIYFGYKRYTKLLTDQCLDRVLIRTLAKYVRLDSQTAV